MKKRKVEIAIISDVHLGTYGSQPKPLLKYLKSIDPKTLILNGDLFDGWQFSKNYWPKAHMKVVKYILGMIAEGTEIHYITGNHDEIMRKFLGFRMGNFQIENKLVLELDGKKAWIFHGDVFDVTMQHSKWIARLGAMGYGFLILLNKVVNFISIGLGRGKLSLSKRIKNGVSNSLKAIGHFEQTAADIAIEKGYDYVICGHIHQPEIKELTNANGRTTYLNSGDWVENCTALEYNEEEWSIYNFYKDYLNLDKPIIEKEEEEEYEPSNSQLFQEMVNEFKML